MKFGIFFTSLASTALLLGACNSPSGGDVSQYTGEIPALEWLDPAGDTVINDPCKATYLDDSEIRFYSLPSDAEVRGRFPEACRNVGDSQVTVRLVKLKFHNSYPATACQSARQYTDSLYLVLDEGDTSYSPGFRNQSYTDCGLSYSYLQETTLSFIRDVPVANLQDSLIRPPFVYYASADVNGDTRSTVEYRRPGEKKWKSLDSTLFEQTSYMAVMIYVDTAAVRANPPKGLSIGDEYRITVRSRYED
jgi:hypothetical protein